MGMTRLDPNGATKCRFWPGSVVKRQWLEAPFKHLRLLPPHTSREQALEPSALATGGPCLRRIAERIRLRSPRCIPGLWSAQLFTILFYSVLLLKIFTDN